MGEIQSAEEFARGIYRACGPIGQNIEDGSSWISEKVRSRDKAIVERILKKVRTITTDKEMSGEASWGWMEARFCAEESIKSVLRDLGIE